MNERTPYKKAEINDIESIKNTVLDSREEICAFLNIQTEALKDITTNLVVNKKLSGHNNDIFIIDFYNTKTELLSRACLKYSSDIEHGDRLKIESEILRILTSKDVACPKLINTGIDRKGNLFILMEAVEGDRANSRMLDIKMAESILDIIKAHESVLSDNLNILKSFNEKLNLDKEVDFENKLSSFLKRFTPHLNVKNSYGFLNKYLNDLSVIKKTIITDRSADNIFINENGHVSMIDFSTVRIGTQFDNWIQFIDDPRAKFSCSKEELILMFFRKNNFNEDVINYYHAASIYTNLLQGIFTYQKNPELSMQYIDNANSAFESFTKKKGVLIDSSH
ncbi:MAG: hypothetical protein PHN56_06780 [Candidatus Nanoarchaeia archaeon]|nr:hypothetical protein [Candidatus Nanoarchaeia archaeon]